MPRSGVGGVIATHLSNSHHHHAAALNFDSLQAWKRCQSCSLRPLSPCIHDWVEVGGSASARVEFDSFLFSKEPFYLLAEGLPRCLTDIGLEARLVHADVISIHVLPWQL